MKQPRPPKPKPPEEMATPWALSSLPTAADEEDPTAVFWGKELRMGPGRVTTTVEGWMTTWESWHCLTQGSLQLSASGVGVATPHAGAHTREQDIFHTSKESCKEHPE